MSATHVSRRHVLRGLGGLALPLPVLPSLLAARRAEAAPAPPLRLMVIQNRDGTFPSQFWPAAPAATRIEDQIWQTPLSAISGPLSPVLGSELDPVRAKVNLVRGMDLFCFAFHQAATFLCCSNTNKESFGEAGPPLAGSAVDCVVEHSAAFSREPAALAALRISEGGRKGSFWRAAGGREGAPVLKPYLKGAQAVFDAVLSRAGAPAPAGAPPPSTADDKLVTDHLLAEYKRFLATSRLGGEDRRRVEQHYQLVHELQKNVLAAETRTVGAPQACTAGSRPAAAAGRAIDRYNSYIDSIVAGLACGVTRIAALVIEAYDDEGQIRSDVHHSNSHGEYKNGRTPQENTALWDGWLAKRVATLIRKLDAVKEPDGSTLLDNTIVVWGNEDGYGKSHSSEEIPILMAGGAGGRLRTGHYLDYREKPLATTGESPARGWPLAALWISVMEALGVTSAEYLKHGDPGGFGQADSSVVRAH